MKSLFISVQRVRDQCRSALECASAFVEYAVGPTFVLVQMSQRLWIRHPILKTSNRPHARRREVLHNRRQNSIAFFLIFHFV